MQKTVKKIEYEVVMTYTEKGGKHSTVETWKCSGKAKLKKVLVDALDLIRDKNGEVTKPNLEKMKVMFASWCRLDDRFTDDKFVQKEFRRAKKAFKVYEEIMARTEIGDCYYCTPLDARTKISVYV